MKKSAKSFEVYQPRLVFLGYVPHTGLHFLDGLRRWTPFGLPPGKSADEVPPSERLFEVGMPIGNLTSQLLANVCLNELDQYIKHELRAHYYVRYMDDMVLLHQDAKTLNEWRQLIEDYLNNVLTYLE